jgi:N-methylhydantoinase B
MAFAVKAVIDKAATRGGPQDGDIWILNDAHLGGTHLNDMRLVLPPVRLVKGGEVQQTSSTF